MIKVNYITESTMKRYLLFSLLITLTGFFLVACGADDTDANNLPSVQNGPITTIGTLDDHKTVKKMPIINKNIRNISLTPPRNSYKWSHIIATGQTACYNTAGKIECPKFGEPFFGQDGSYKVGVRSYDTSAGDNTVLDEVTHLRWQQTFASGLTWFQAKTHCQQLELAGIEWRLPTTVELKTLVDYGASSPAINSTAFPDTPSDWFWASEAHNATNASWVIYFLDGFVEYTAQTNEYSVRCVAR